MEYITLIMEPDRRAEKSERPQRSLKKQLARVKSYAKALDKMSQQQQPSGEEG